MIFSTFQIFQNLIINSRDQMHASQEGKSVLQKSLIEIQSELAGKKSQIEQLKIELLQSSKVLEDERQRSLMEKKALKGELEEFMQTGKSRYADNQELTSADDGNEELKIQIEIYKDEIRGCESRNEILSLKLKEAIEANEAMQKDFEESNLKVQTLSDKLEGINSSEKMFIDELEAKNKVIEGLRGEKLSLEISQTRIKSELDELRQSWFEQTDQNKDLKEDYNTMKEKFVKLQADLEQTQLELKHFTHECSKSKIELESSKSILEEHMDLRKELLKQNTDVQKENKELKAAFAAADEARTELETALEDVKVKNDELKKLASKRIESSASSEDYEDAKKSLALMEQMLLEKSANMEILEDSCTSLKVGKHYSLNTS